LVDSELFGNGRQNNFGAPDQIEDRRFVSTSRKRPAQRSNEPEIGRVRKQRPEKKGDVLLGAAFRPVCPPVAAKIKRPQRPGLLDREIA